MEGVVCGGEGGDFVEGEFGEEGGVFVCDVYLERREF